ncbi:MAG: hypothetical protein O2960_05705 [Verrucomicrobia bacterium]|nr:hypothetical protein [Verrucomicrobiota bacterium]
MKEYLKTIGLAALVLEGAFTAVAQTEWLENLDDALFIEARDGWFRSDLSGLIDLETYYIDERPPGLIFSDDEVFFNPRLSMFLDTKLGDHFYSFAQLRLDRGFDPGSRSDGDVRLDEYFLRYTPFDDPRVNFQVGKFATVVGNWVSRHLSWENPFINAPLPYENVVIVTDHEAPTGPGNFLARRNRALGDNRATWIPVIWGPSYTSGGSVFGLVDKFEYAFEIKNVALSSRPYAWDATRHGWDYPVVSGRLGYRPNAAWNIGASFSHGAYLLPPEDPLSPGGPSKGSFKQTTIGHDIGYSWRHWQFWAEAFASRFEVPNVGDADTLSYYLEARYKIRPQLYGALRWNQQFFNKVPNGVGGEERWDRDIWRIESALGYRFDRHLQGKLQYSLSRQNGLIQQGEQLVAVQLTIKF